MNQRWKLSRTARVLSALVAAGSLLLASIPAAAQTEFLIRMRDGNQLLAKLETSELPWSEIRPDGSVVERSATLGSIRSIEFSRLSVRESAAEIHSLLEQLGSPDYHVRNRSEETLLKKGGQFVDLIEHAKTNANPEVRYRVGRLLTKLRAKGVKQVSAEYDELVVDGNSEPVRGDLADWSPTVHVFGRTLTLNRKNVLSIHRGATGSEGQAEGDRPAAALSLNEPGTEFYRPGDIHIDFDNGRRGESFLVSENIARSFIDRGVIFSGGADPATSVIAAGFRIPQGRSAKNSAATMTLGDRYKGTMRIDFCVPSLPEVPATVHRIGCYVAVVQDPGELVLRAYDRHGTLVGSAVAMGKTSFVGVVSPQPIAWATLSSNRDLPLPASEIDDDFAIDDLVCDPPQADPMRPCGQQVTVALLDGTRVSGAAAQFEGDTVRLLQTALGEEPLILHRGEVRSIAWGNHPAEPRSEQLWSMLRDGSLVPLAIPAAGELRTVAPPEAPLELTDVAALFGGARGLVLPGSIAVDRQRPVAMFLFGHVAPGPVQLAPERISWPADASTFVAPSGLESLPNPQYPHEFPPPQLPSLWWEAPPLPTANDAGALDLTDQQHIVFRRDGRYQLERCTPQEVVVTVGGSAWPIPWSRVQAIRFPPH